MSTSVIFQVTLPKSYQRERILALEDQLSGSCPEACPHLGPWPGVLWDKDKDERARACHYWEGRTCGQVAEKKWYLQWIRETVTGIQRKGTASSSRQGLGMMVSRKISGRRWLRIKILLGLGKPSHGRRANCEWRYTADGDRISSPSQPDSLRTKTSTWPSKGQGSKQPTWAQAWTGDYNCPI